MTDGSHWLEEWVKITSKNLGEVLRKNRDQDDLLDCRLFGARTSRNTHRLFGGEQIRFLASYSPSLREHVRYVPFCVQQRSFEEPIGDAWKLNVLAAFFVVYVRADMTEDIVPPSKPTSTKSTGGVHTGIIVGSLFVAKCNRDCKDVRFRALPGGWLLRPPRRESAHIQISDVDYDDIVMISFDFVSRDVQGVSTNKLQQVRGYLICLGDILKYSIEAVDIE